MVLNGAVNGNSGDRRVAAWYNAVMFEQRHESQLHRAFEEARERYAAFGVDADAAVQRLKSVEVSMNCWQGDDVVGFEGAESASASGIIPTGNHPGRARTADELRADAERSFSLIPGRHRFNLHAMYLETDSDNVDRNAIDVRHFQRWIDWSRTRDIPLDFNPTFFAHRMADSGFTLASKDRGIRDFWIEHGKRSRSIAAEIGFAQGSACVNNFWIPDGSKDEPVDRLGHREILIESLDTVFRESLDPRQTVDSVEGKLFGPGSEAYVVGSHEFYLSYALTRGMMLTMDSGHFHPSESLADKISAILPFTGRLMLHLSRPIRWDSDHVVVADDMTRAVAREIVRADAFEQVHLAVDFFDPSINRITAWVVGMRAVLKALLEALLEPRELLLERELAGRLGDRLAVSEAMRALPFGAVWDMFCLENEVPPGADWLKHVHEYERQVLAYRE